MTRPHPLGLAVLYSMGFVLAADEAGRCQDKEGASAVPCWRPAGHGGPLSHVGMWQSPDDPDDWLVTAWPVVD